MKMIPETESGYMEALMRSLYGLISSLRTHQPGNRLVTGHADTFMEAVDALTRERGQITVRFLSGRVHVEKQRLSYKPETVAIFDSLIDFFEVRNIRGFCIDEKVKAVERDAIFRFARMLNSAEKRKNPLEWILSYLQDEEFSWFGVVQESLPGVEESSAEAEVRRDRGLKSYSHVLGSVKEIAGKLISQKEVGMNRTRRVVQNMVDLIMEDDPLFRALSTIRFYDDYTYCHSVNVAILSMCIGKRILLSKKSLENLGLCGLLHDLGKIEIPKEILNKPGKLTPEEFEIIKQHSVNSVRLIIKIQASRDQKADILLAPFEHHLKYDLSGYPKLEEKTSLSLFGRILTIADVYDAITSPRVYRPTILPPDRALGFMWENVGKDFDPILLKVFINMLGIYPVGTLLQLDNGALGIVTEPPPGEAPALPGRPWVVQIEPDGADGYERIGQPMNLSENNRKNSTYAINIIKTINPWEMGIQPLDYII